MSKVMTGARAKLFVDQALVGIFESCNWNQNFGNEAIHILGRFSPDEIVITSAEAVPVNCSGFKVVGAGVHTLPKVPKIQDLLDLDDIVLQIVDRQTSEAIFTLLGAKAVGHSGGVQARATSRVTVNYIGTRMQDEDGAQDEAAGAAFLPNG
jgi:hypothetical protein